MTAIQIILIIGILFLYTYFLLNLKKRIPEFIFFSLIALGAVLFIIDPDLSTVIAKILGVQRGVDLIFYLAILFFMYLFMKLYLRIKKLEQIITSVIREEALQHVTIPAKS